MGYCMSQQECQFFIAKKDCKKALRAIKDLAKKKDQRSGWGPEGTHFAWVDNDFVESKTLEDILAKWRWRPEFNKEGDLVFLDFEGEKSGDDFILFQALAPYVKDGSYIQMSGENNVFWRWVFQRGEVEEQYAEITWK